MAGGIELGPLGEQVARPVAQRLLDAVCDGGPRGEQGLEAPVVRVPSAAREEGCGVRAWRDDAG